MNTVKIDKYFKGMIAHRGLSGIETENTVNAFLAAANRSYFGIETDVHASRDGKIIITHDDTLLRLGMLNLYIPSFRYEEIRKFSLIDRKSGNLSDTLFIPLLSDYLLICKTYKKHAVIELKGILSNENLEAILGEIRRMGIPPDQFSLISFNDKYLTGLRKSNPDMDLYFLSGEVNEKILDFCEKHRLNLDAWHESVDEATVKRLHLIGLKVNVWTVDDKETAERLIKMGVDYITSNILE